MGCIQKKYEPFDSVNNRFWAKMRSCKNRVLMASPLCARVKFTDIFLEAPCNFTSIDVRDLNHFHFPTFQQLLIIFEFHIIPKKSCKDSFSTFGRPRITYVWHIRQQKVHCDVTTSWQEVVFGLSIFGEC